MTITRLHHAQITVPPEGQATTRWFYCALLGLSESTKPTALDGRSGFWLRLGDQQLHIGVERGSAHDATKAHLAHEVGDLTMWRERLVAGIVALARVPLPRYERFGCRGPFGKRRESTQPLDLPDQGADAQTRD